MTNNHVFGDEDEANSAILQFNYRLLTNEDLTGKYGGITLGESDVLQSQLKNLYLFPFI